MVAGLHVSQYLAQALDFSRPVSITNLHNTLGKRPALFLARHRILHRGRDAGPNTHPAKAILADALDITQASEAFLACESAVPRAGDSTKGELDGIVSGEVVDSNHARLKATDDGAHGGIALGAVNGGAETKVGCVCDGEHVLCRGGLGPQHGQDGGEALLLGDAHVGSDVDEEGGLEVVAPGVVGVVVSRAAGEEPGPLLNGLGNELLEPVERGVRDHGADVGIRAEAERPDAGRQHVDELVVGAGRRDDALDADAVLAGGLEGAPQDDLCYAREVAGGRVEHDEGVLAAQLGHDGRQAPGRAGGDVVRDRLRADEGDVAYARVRGQVPCRLGPAGDGLDEGGIVAVGGQRPAGHLCEVGARPGRLLRDLDDDGVAGEEGGHDGAHHVVEGVVPGHEGRDHAQRLVVDRVSLVRHEEVRGPARGPQRLLAVQQRPLDLLDRDEDLAQLRVNHGLAAVETCDSANVLGVVQDVLHEGAEDGSALAKRRLPPCLLGGGRGGDGAVDSVRRGGVDETEELARGRGVALDGRGPGDFDAGLLNCRLGFGKFGGRDAVSNGSGG